MNQSVIEGTQNKNCTVFEGGSSNLWTQRYQEISPRKFKKESEDLARKELEEYKKRKYQRFSNPAKVDANKSLYVPEMQGAG